ncbi:MAG: sulfotransferase [Bacteroidetes bacterium]|nr:sulfotransferase [Bacteroidota bacterium]
MENEKVKVLYIGGTGRSGSTLLNKLLGEVDDLFSAGELTQIWEQGFADNYLCSCKKTFSSCDVWSEIVQNGLPGMNVEMINKAVQLKSSLVRIKNYTRRNTQDYKTNAYTFCNDYIQPLYKSIIEITGKKMIIDSSKMPTYLYLLSQCSDLELFVIHLVRDSRAVAWSSAKGGYKRMEITEKEELKRGNSYYKSIKQWVTTNYMMNSLRSSLPQDHSLLIRYEDLIQAPKETIKGILDFAGMTDPLNFFVDERSVLLNRDHMVAGNRMRFTEGQIEIRTDEEWKEGMSFLGRSMVSLLTYPMMKKYYG